MTQYQELGPYSDLAARLLPRLALTREPGDVAALRDALARCLDIGIDAPDELDIQKGPRWVRDDVEGLALSWDVGYGPRTEAWLLRPKGVTKPLPGILALHDHGGFKFHGKEKIADGPDGAVDAVLPLRSQCYDGVAFANELARQGFAVLVHDVFMWGSRRMPLENMPEWDRVIGEACVKIGAVIPGVSHEISRYNSAAGAHEHSMEKYGRVLGFSLAGIVNHEDRIALSVLAKQAGVCSDRIGCVGLSGGGCRSTLLRGNDERIKAAVVVGMMSTYESLLDHNISHSWMFFVPGWAQHGDWPDIPGCRAPSPLLVQYDLDDTLFTQSGMRAADGRLAKWYRAAGAPDAYRGEFYPGPHKFDRAMQANAFGWLRRLL